jgi:glyoxylase-like metal-dependent hydrolase (beta-lactamase superfamily II)
VSVAVTRVLAPNPGLYTGPGTNTWIIEADGEALVVDPGPIIDEHADAIVAALGHRVLAGVLVTHTHRDHAPLANPLGRDLGVEVLGHAPGPEFEPDRRLAEGDEVTLGGSTLTVLHTPGHADDHLCFLVGTELFTGDHIMGGSTVMIEDLSAYLTQLRRLRDLTLTRLYPGHGPVIEDPVVVIDHYIEHRLERERQIVAALIEGHDTIGDVVGLVYSDIDTSLHPLAAHSVAAHVRKLVDDGTVRFEQTGDLWNGIVRLIAR